MTKFATPTHNQNLVKECYYNHFSSARALADLPPYPKRTNLKKQTRTEFSNTAHDTISSLANELFEIKFATFGLLGQLADMTDLCGLLFF